MTEEITYIGELNIYPCFSITAIRQLWKATFLERLAFKVNMSHFTPQVTRWFQEVKVPRLRHSGPGWW